MTPPVIEVRALFKTYGHGESAVRALGGPRDPATGRRPGIELLVEQGDFVAVMGSSGSGKSTLMNILGCLDVPTSGRYLLDGIDVGGLDEHQLSLVRNRKIGFVFQSFNLVPRTSAVAQVELPLAYAGVKAAERRRRAVAALTLVGLADRLDHRPNELSGGQQQRVAVARALVTAPAMLLADEPTGNLDSHSTEEVLALVDRLNASGRTVVLITHEDEVARHAKRVLRLVDGQIVEDVRQAPVGGPPPAMSESAAHAVAGGLR
ncbi:ABC transporter ATP-binding protein [Streptomyces sp. NPDC051109]|uniref:ABC transporter ATP-binding protein n=1 Tax=Streptomyces sp. NPDC051109 TaxID=3365642 RepID=UPI0037B8BB14